MHLFSMTRLIANNSNVLWFRFPHEIILYDLQVCSCSGSVCMMCEFVCLNVKQFETGENLSVGVYQNRKEIFVTFTRLKTREADSNNYILKKEREQNSRQITLI